MTYFLDNPLENVVKIIGLIAVMYVLYKSLKELDK